MYHGTHLKLLDYYNILEEYGEGWNEYQKVCMEQFIIRGLSSKQCTQQWYIEERANKFDERISAKCRCCDDGEDKTILHILRCSSRKEVLTEHKQIFIQQVTETEAPNHLLHLSEAGIKLALINGDTHSGEDWNGNSRGSMMEMQ